MPLDRSLDSLPAPLAALAWPLRGPGAERPVLATWLCLLAATLAAVVPLLPILPLLPVAGYGLRALVAGAEGDPAPRLLTDPGDLLRTGLGASVVAFGYLAVPAVVLAVTVTGLQSAPAVGTSDWLTLGLVAAGSTTVLFTALAGAYLCPVALTAYGREGTLRAAVDAGHLRRTGAHWAYFVDWTAAAVTLGVAGTLVRAAWSIQRLGPLVGTAVLAYALLLACHWWGRGVGRAGGSG